MPFTEFREKALQTKREKMRGDRLYGLEREFAVRLSWLLFRLFPSIRPNQVTLLSCGLLLGTGVLATVIIYDVNGATEYALLGFALLYAVSITDKIDGGIARVRELCTQKGMYLDRAVHCAYPAVFYFLVATFFWSVHSNAILFSLTLFAGLLTQMLVSQYEWRLLVGEKIRKEDSIIRDLYFSPHTKGRQLIFPLRISYYLTFMIYAWTLFFYAILTAVSVIAPQIAYVLYGAHIIGTIIVNVYIVFIHFPQRKLYTIEEAENLKKKI